MTDSKSPTPDVSTASEGGFAALGVSPAYLKALGGLGYEEPTPIQKEAIPVLLSGRDLLGQAATGTGKTAAFSLPLLQRITAEPPKPNRPRALVLVPTRELAMQVAEAIHKYGSERHGTVVPIYGGQQITRQFRALDRGVTCVVATPGRAVDHLERGSLNLEDLAFVVLDEADEMLDMGFADDLDAILKRAPATRQTALFAATMPPRIRSIVERHLKDPVRISIARERTPAGGMPRIRQTAYVVTRFNKPAALARILDIESPTSAIVFCRTRIEVDELVGLMGAHGYRAEALHGGFVQEQRDRVMKRFRSGAAELLVATDVASRGIDIDHVSHVVNYDVPSEPETYVHRIGRTGRAGREGVAITLVEPREQRLLRNIEFVTRQKVAVAAIPTAADLRHRRLELLKDSIRAALAAGSLDDYRNIVVDLAAEADVMEVAAAAVKLASQAGGDAESPKDDERDLSVAPSPRSHDDRRRPFEKFERPESSTVRDLRPPMSPRPSDSGHPAPGKPPSRNFKPKGFKSKGHAAGRKGRQKPRPGRD